MPESIPVLTSEEIAKYSDEFKRMGDRIRYDDIRRKLGESRGEESRGNIGKGIIGGKEDRFMPILMGSSDHGDFAEDDIQFYIGEGSGDLKGKNKTLRDTIETQQPIFLFGISGSSKVGHTGTGRNFYEFCGVYRLLGEPVKRYIQKEKKEKGKEGKKENVEESTVLIFPMLDLSRYDEMTPEERAAKYQESLDILDRRFPGRTGGEHDQTFPEMLRARGLHYEDRLVEDFLLSIEAKHFVILSGGSGNGKTSMAIAYGEYVSSEDDKRYLVVPVGSNWTDGTNLLGYFNPLSNEYVKTSTLDFLLKHRDVDGRYVLILDEMNLSHVEYYFSDFLSAMESGEPIRLGNGEDAPELYLDENLVVIGTINMDETTYSFSPKVLDRANVIEFPPADPRLALGMEGWMDGTDMDDENPNALSIATRFRQDGLDDVVTGIADLLDGIQKQMGGMGLSFGYRTMDEIMRFMYLAEMNTADDFHSCWKRYMDSQIMQKILPKIHGDTSIRGPLERMKGIVTEALGAGSRSVARMECMLNILKDRRYVSYNDQCLPESQGQDRP